jgi:hypothetical protein
MYPSPRVWETWPYVGCEVHRCEFYLKLHRLRPATWDDVNETQDVVRVERTFPCKKELDGSLERYGCVLSVAWKGRVARIGVCRIGADSTLSTPFHKYDDIIVFMERSTKAAPRGSPHGPHLSKDFVAFSLRCEAAGFPGVRCLGAALLSKLPPAARVLWIHKMQSLRGLRHRATHPLTRNAYRT